MGEITFDQLRAVIEKISATVLQMDKTAMKSPEFDDMLADCRAVLVASLNVLERTAERIAMSDALR